MAPRALDLATNYTGSPGWNRPEAVVEDCQNPAVAVPRQYLDHARL
jgi:hypothetical protein